MIGLSMRRQLARYSWKTESGDMFACFFYESTNYWIGAGSHGPLYQLGYTGVGPRAGGGHSGRRLFGPVGPWRLGSLSTKKGHCKS